MTLESLAVAVIVLAFALRGALQFFPTTSRRLLAGLRSLLGLKAAAAPAATGCDSGCGPCSGCGTAKPAAAASKAPLHFKPQAKR